MASLNRARVNRLALVLLAAAALAPASAGSQVLDRRVRIVNDSKHEMTGFFAVNFGIRDWPASLLGTDTLRPGASVVLNFEDASGYCRYRFRATFDDGVELIRESVNVCEVGTYRYTD